MGEDEGVRMMEGGQIDCRNDGTDSRHDRKPNEDWKLENDWWSRANRTIGRRCREKVTHGLLSVSIISRSRRA